MPRPSTGGTCSPSTGMTSSSSSEDEVELTPASARELRRRLDQVQAAWDALPARPVIPPVSREVREVRWSADGPVPLLFWNATNNTLALLLGGPEICTVSGNAEDGWTIRRVEEVSDG